MKIVPSQFPPPAPRKKKKDHHPKLLVTLGLFGLGFSFFALAGVLFFYSNFDFLSHLALLSSFFGLAFVTIGLEYRSPYDHFDYDDHDFEKAVDLFGKPPIIRMDEPISTSESQNRVPDKEQTKTAV